MPLRWPQPPPLSMLVMDNCAIHHVSRTVEMIYKTGALVHFLPPRLFQSNACFQKVKTVLKGVENDFEPTDDLEMMIITAVS
jgi:hypothetical protein